MRHAGSFIELCGMALMSFGAYQLAPWLGWVAAGAAVIIVGQAVGGNET